MDNNTFMFLWPTRSTNLWRENSIFTLDMEKTISIPFGISVSVGVDDPNGKLSKIPFLLLQVWECEKCVHCECGDHQADLKESIDPWHPSSEWSVEVTIRIPWGFKAYWHPGPECDSPRQPSVRAVGFKLYPLSHHRSPVLMQQLGGEMNGNARGEDNGDSANSCFLFGCPQSTLPPFLLCPGSGSP